MKLKLLVLACFAVALTINAAPLLNNTLPQSDKQKMPAKYTFPSAQGEKWGPVPYDHDQHNGFSDCMVCHHTNKELTLDTWNKGYKENVPLCVSCHLREEGNAKNPKNADGEELTAKIAYHHNCIDCHKGEMSARMQQYGKITKSGEGPVKCAACHQVKE
jgi:hypothetical protein